MQAESISPAMRKLRFGLAVALFFASFIIVKPLWWLLGVHGPARFVFLLIPAAGMVLFIRAVRWNRFECGEMNAALSRYLNRFMLCMLAYMALLVLATSAREQMGMTGLSLAVVQVLPVIPILGCIFVIGRYLVEEQDEYLRMQTAKASLIATGILLAVASIWGFLEQAKLVSHVPASSAFIIWASGLGIGQIVQRARGA